MKSSSTASVLDVSIPLSFCFASFGYMIIWTGICSRVSYLSSKFGPIFFVWVNVAFYSTGLPIAILQKFYDSSFDGRLSSKGALSFRILIGVLGLAICALLLPFLSSFFYILVVVFIGFFTWAVHGSVSKAAALVQYNSSIWQQVGFAFPGVVCAILLAILTTFNNVETREVFFYFTLSVMAMLSLLGHWYILSNQYVIDVLDAKDDELYHHPEDFRVACNESDSVSSDNESLSVSLLSSSSEKKSSGTGDTDFLHLTTVFIIIFASTMQGSFISFVVQSNNFPIREALFFTRLFADMLGRPLVAIRLPPLFDSLHALLFMACVRVILCGIFFLVVFRPIINYSLIISMQTIISLSSGYIVTSVYQKATLLSQSQQRKYRIFARLNLSFQAACASSCLAAGVVLFTLSR